jgi:hypothetical protein
MNEPETSSDIVPKATKLWCWFGGWGLAAGATLVANPAHLLMAPFFPIGLLALLPDGEKMAITAYMMIFPIGLGWIFYGIYSWVLLSRRGATVFYTWFVFFCVILILNVVGCQKVMQAAAGIH